MILTMTVLTNINGMLIKIMAEGGMQNGLLSKMVNGKKSLCTA